MVSVNSINKQTLIEYEDFLFMYIENLEEFDNAKMFYVDAIIINSTDKHLFKKVLDGARTHYDPEIYLKPIFCVKYEDLPDILIQQCDGTTDVTQYQHIGKITKEIKNQTAKLFLQQKFPNNEFAFVYKTLQFLFTRNIEMIPIADRKSRLNFFFPFIQRLIEDKEQFKIIEILNMAVKDGFLREEETIDKIHLCDDCHSAHHNIRETCIHCDSIDLKVEDLIHHFQCAYIGPETDFNNEFTDELICPKCQKILRHIGVDYDKPSHIFGCYDCNEHFQNPKFTYRCVDCSKVSDIRHLSEFILKKLSLTAKGKHLVLSGLPRKAYETEKAVKEIPGIYDLEIFKNILTQEHARTSLNPGKTFFGSVTLIDDEMNKISWREKAVLQSELTKVLKSYLKDHDMVTSVSPGKYYFLLLETTEKKVEELKDLIIYNLEYLVKSNIEKSKVKAEVTIQKMVHSVKVNL